MMFLPSVRRPGRFPATRCLRLAVELGVLLAAGTGCTIGDAAHEDRDSVPPFTEAASSTPPESDSASPASPRSSSASHSSGKEALVSKDTLEAAVEHVRARWGGAAGIALFDGESLYTAGTTAGYPAWSTSKVPVAIAAEQEGVADPDAVNAAITYSDNAAAEKLWESLGDPATAGQKTEDVLAEGGDSTTRVATERSRGEFSSFGQTRWRLTDQAVFAFNLPNIESSARVLRAMSTPDPAQDYGLRALPNAAMKGGWGPDREGAYDVVQIGHLTFKGHEVGVAIFAHPADGLYATAQQALTQLATEAFSGESAAAE